MSKSKGYYARFYEMENYSFTPMEEVFSTDPDVWYARIYRELKKDYLKARNARSYLSFKLTQMTVHVFFISFRTYKRSPELTFIRISTQFVNLRSLRILIL